MTTSKRYFSSHSMGKSLCSMMVDHQHPGRSASLIRLICLCWHCRAVTTSTPHGVVQRVSVNYIYIFQQNHIFCIIWNNCGNIITYWFKSIRHGMIRERYDGLIFFNFLCSLAGWNWAQPFSWRQLYTSFKHGGARLFLSASFTH